MLYTWAFNNTGTSIWSAVFFYWIYTYILDTMSAGLAPLPEAYQILQYAPYIIIAVLRRLVQIVNTVNTLHERLETAGRIRSGRFRPKTGLGLGYNVIIKTLL